MNQPLHHSRPTLGQQELDALSQVIQSHYLAKGKLTQKFEETLEERYSRKHVIFVSNGMAALHLSLHALGVDKNSQVALPSYVCTALLNAIHLCGAQPVITDTEHRGFLMNPDLSDIKHQTIIYPQLFGAQTKLSSPKNALLIEDCAMSMGPEALSQGVISIASFYATKMITTGQGGAIFTDNEQLADLLRDLIDYDNREDYKPRFNYAPTDLSAALGLSQLERLDGLLEQRKNLAMLYDEQIQKNCPELLAQPGGLSQDYPYLFRYWVKSKQKTKLQEYLASLSIESKSPVYKPLHQYLGLKDEAYPNASEAQRKILSLPFYPGLNKQDIQRVVEALAKF